jgi:hypothetical protein
VDRDQNKNKAFELVPRILKGRGGGKQVLGWLNPPPPLLPRLKPSATAARRHPRTLGHSAAMHTTLRPGHQDRHHPGAFTSRLRVALLPLTCACTWALGGVAPRPWGSTTWRGAPMLARLPHARRPRSCRLYPQTSLSTPGDCCQHQPALRGAGTCGARRYAQRPGPVGLWGGQALGGVIPCVLLRLT